MSVLECETCKGTGKILVDDDKGRQVWRSCNNCCGKGTVLACP